MIALISFNFVPLASAADDGSVSTTLRVTWTGNNVYEAASGFFGRNDAVDYSDHSFSSAGTRWCTIGSVDMVANDWLSGSVGVYISFYWTTNGTSTFELIEDNFSGSNAPVLYYINNLGQEGTGSTTVSYFTPVNDASNISTGFTVKASTVADSYAPVSQVGFKQMANYQRLHYERNVTRINLFIPSVAVIATASSEDLAAMEGIANSIAAQSQIMSAMYGDIMSVCNSIYSRLGDMQATAELANGYFQGILDVLNSMSTTQSNIYSLLQAQFDIIKAVIETESGDIQSAIEKQTDDLKAYFDDVLGGAVGTLPDDNASTDDIINETHDDEQQYHSDALNRFNELSASFSGFNGDVGSGIALAGTLFSRVWGALGNYVIVYTFPLLLGLALVIIGRLGRGMVKKSSQDRNADD